MAIQTDVSDGENIRKTLSEIKKTFGAPPDLVVHLAAILKVAPSFLEMDMKDIDTMIDVNLRGAIMVNQEAAKTMIEAKVKMGAIINVSSEAGKLTNRLTQPLVNSIHHFEFYSQVLSTIRHDWVRRIQGWSYWTHKEHC